MISIWRVEKCLYCVCSVPVEQKALYPEFTIEATERRSTDLKCGNKMQRQRFAFNYFTS